MARRRRGKILAFENVCPNGGKKVHRRGVLDVGWRTQGGGRGVADAGWRTRGRGRGVVDAGWRTQGGRRRVADAREEGGRWKNEVGEEVCARLKDRTSLDAGREKNT